MTRTSSGFSPNNLKQVSSAHEGELFIDSDFFQQQQLNLPSCGLARYKSAPSSFLAALLDPNNTNDNSSSGDESEAFFSALIGGPAPDLNQTFSNQMQYHMIKQEASEVRSRKDGSVNGQMGYESAVNSGGSCIVGSYFVEMESEVNNNNNNNNNNNGTTMSCGNNSSCLVRQSSSTADFLNGSGVMGEVGNYRVQNQAKPVLSANSGKHIDILSAPSSTTARFMPSIPENENQDIVTHNLGNGHLRKGNNADVSECEAVFTHGSWKDSPFSNSLKRNRDGEMKTLSDFDGLDNRNIGESRKGSSGLAHHLSLPKTSTEMAEVEKLLQFQPKTVPCQVRAKRGCATHPRSIAERMRRTRISEKMKKLQDLFPNIDKQTSTADMLDLAVEYIKDLQKQVQTLKDTKAKCICSG